MSATPGGHEAAIREQAYYFWEQDGRPEGREMEYWSRASIALAGKAQVDTLTKAPPKKPIKAAASTVKPAPAKAAKAKPAGKAKPKKK